MEVSDAYFMTKENRLFNVFLEDSRPILALRFRGSAFTNLGSITIRGPAITTWDNSNSYYLDKTLKEVDDDYTDIVEFISKQM